MCSRLPNPSTKQVYFTRPTERKTILSKQWILKDILIEIGYEYTDYGQGSYSIPGHLKPVSPLYVAADVGFTDVW